MWIYVQRTGALYNAARQLEGTGYAGIGAGKNNPAAQSLRNTGPLPCGDYTIGPAFDSITHGPITMRLTPDASNVMYGRSGFLLHADSVKHPGEASNGCIVQHKAVRQIVSLSDDRRLRVVSDLEPR